MEIKINNLIKRYGSKTAVDIPDFTLHEGEILGLVGNNGAGKTTLFRLMLDLLQADSGTVCMNGTDVARSEEWKTFTGAYMDESFLIDYLTPDEYFQFNGRMCGLDRSTVNERIRRYERFLGPEILEEKKFIRNLSAGNKQKIGIISAMLNAPKLLILDEPFNFLDPSSQNHLKNILTEYNAQTGATVLISSHNLTHTVDISGRIALLESGRIIKDLTNTDNSAEKELEDYFNIQ